MTRTARSGFTLLEILVVLAILGMGLALVTSMTTHSARYSERVEEETNVQLALENMMNSILSGNTTATLGVEIPIPDAPRWFAKVELLDGPIDNVVAIRITAQRYETIQVLTTNNPNVETTARLPEDGRRVVLKEWARRSSVKTRAVSVDGQGRTRAIDGTGETYLSDLSSTDPDVGGGLLAAPPESFVDNFAPGASAFDALDAASASFEANRPGGVAPPANERLGGGGF